MRPQVLHLVPGKGKLSIQDMELPATNQSDNEETEKVNKTLVLSRMQEVIGDKNISAIEKYIDET